MYIHNGHDKHLAGFKEALQEVKKNLSVPMHTWSPDSNTMRVEVGFSLTLSPVQSVAQQCVVDERADAFGAAVSEMQSGMAVLDISESFQFVSWDAMPAYVLLLLSQWVSLLTFSVECRVPVVWHDFAAVVSLGYMFNFMFNPRDIYSKAQLGYHFPRAQFMHSGNITGLFTVPLATLRGMLVGGASPALSERVEAHRVAEPFIDLARVTRSRPAFSGIVLPMMSAAVSLEVLRVPISPTHVLALFRELLFHLFPLEAICQDLFAQVLSISVVWEHGLVASAALRGIVWPALVVDGHRKFAPSREEAERLVQSTIPHAGMIGGSGMMGMLQSPQQFHTMTTLLPDTTVALRGDQGYFVDEEPTELLSFCEELAQWAFGVTCCEGATEARLTVSDRMLGLLFQVYLGFCRGVREDALVALTHDILRCFRASGMPLWYPCRVGLSRPVVRIRTLRDSGHGEVPAFHFDHLASDLQCEVDSEAWLRHARSLDTHFGEVGAYMQQLSSVMLYKFGDIYRRVHRH